MAGLAIEELPVMVEEDTHAGNYFVSNYPPFSFWSRDRADQASEVIQRPPQVHTPLGLYLHIPFCRKRCHFCYFKVYTDQNAAEIKNYLEYLKKEIRLYRDRPFLLGRKPKFIYFGGGTPSYISAHQLRDLTEDLRSVLPWDEAEEIAFECEPGTLTETKIRAIRDIGVTRLSLGIENFDDHILEINGRAHRTEEIGRAYDFARSVGFPQINIDLISGMIGETEENWQRCVERTLALEPDSITIYQMEIPFNTTIYQEMKETGKEAAPVAEWKTKRRWVKEAFERLEAAGYTVGSAYTAVKDPCKTKFLYRDELWRGADLLSLGVASFSHIQGTHFQNEKDNPPYFERIDAGELPIRRAYKLTRDEELIREFILQMKLGRVSRSYFQEKFSVDICERFAAGLGELKSIGFIELDEEEVRLSRDALLRVDGLLPLFYLEHHRSDRYV